MVSGSSSTIALYSESTVVICWPAWMRPRSCIAFSPSPAAPMPSAACRRAANALSVSKAVSPAAVSPDLANRCATSGSRSRRSSSRSTTARTATVSSVRCAVRGTYQARSAVKRSFDWEVQVIAMADHVSEVSPRSTRSFAAAAPAARCSSSFPRAYETTLRCSWPRARPLVAVFEAPLNGVVWLIMSAMYASRRVDLPEPDAPVSSVVVPANRTSW